MKTIPWLFGAKRTFVKNSHAILEKYGVKLLGTQDELSKANTEEIHNLCYAMNGYQGIHSTAYAKAVWAKLDAAVKAGKGNYDRTRTLIIDALDDMKETLERGGKFW